MPLPEANIREQCTDAVFERGETYVKEGRVHRIDRFESRLTATVQGSNAYDVTVDLASTPFSSNCTCPYDGPGICKHVIATLLTAKADDPDDESDRVDALLSEMSAEDLKTFLYEELARDPELRDRFFAQFGESDGRSASEYQQEVDQLFEQHANDYLVFEAIDFSRFADLAERYREQGKFEQAATVYRGLVTGLDENMDRVDASYDHYSRTFRTALEAYVECVQNAELTDDERAEHRQFLAERASTGPDYLREHYREMADELETRR